VAIADQDGGVVDDSLIAPAGFSLDKHTQQQEGFKEALVIGDRATGKTYSVTLWESEADAQRTLTSDMMRDILARVAPLVTAPPTQENLEVLLHEEA
jgi:quinol monooxygenase YgiN